MTYTLVRLNFVHADPTDPEQMSDRYRAGLEIARYVDTAGFNGISLEEHHSSTMAWSPTPLMNAGMILASTEQITCTISALLLPLHDPIRVAEDLAVIDLVSKGRIMVCTGLGYREVEYAAMGKEWSRRGKILDEALDVMLKAWTGEPFEHNGQMVQVTPLPYTRPHPMVFVGGSAPASAKRAARLGLPLQLPGQFPEIEELYNAECERLGTQGFVIAPDHVAMVHIAEDPDRVWAELGDHFMLEAMTYKNWQPPGQTSAVCSKASTVEELRAEGIYQVLTPAEATERARATGALSLHPLVGGMPIDEAWSSVELAVDKVLPALKQ
ncbi:MAG: LLM class flavin-dependent oxidoreductase [Acidimicrobiales bacterium]|nr:LLM class flavin-dependent oxidoreductase [Acidimicrobiales bacterium]